MFTKKLFLHFVMVPLKVAYCSTYLWLLLSWTDLINANVDAQESIGAAFNEQVQIYRASSD